MREGCREGAGVSGNASSTRYWMRRCDGSYKSTHTLAAAHHLAHLTLEHLGRRELLEPQMTHGRVEQNTLRDETDDLAPRYLRAFRLGLHLYEIEGVMKWGLLRVDQVHRDLGLTIDLESEAFHVLEPSGRSAHCFGDALRNLKIRGGAKVDVVGDEEWSRTDGDRPAGGMDFGGTEVRVSIWILAQLLAEALEFSTTNIREILSRWSRRRALVEINGNLQLSPDSLAECAGESDAILHRGSFEGNEGHNVGCANARMLAGMLTQIDLLTCHLDACKRSLNGSVDRRDEGDHRPVMRSIGRDI